jgi:hypothetical protein
MEESWGKSEAEDEEDDEELLAWEGNGHVEHNEMRGDEEREGDVQDSEGFLEQILGEFDVP